MGFPAKRCEDLFLLAFLGLTRFDPSVFHNLGRHSSNRMPHDMFADCDLSPMCSGHSFKDIYSAVVE